MSGDLYNDIRLAQQGDKQRAGEIVSENAGLIWSVVRRYIGRGVDAEDLYQLGCLGFLKAIEGKAPACQVRARGLDFQAGEVSAIRPV